MHYTTLDFGNPTDARSWEKGCASLGLTQGSSVMSMSPGLQRLQSFFATVPDWVFLSGHYYKCCLYARANDESPLQDHVQFGSDRVKLTCGDGSAILHKDYGFKMHRNLSLIIWGGCSACKDTAQIQTLRKLFDNPTMLGFGAKTGWQINNAMLGGGFLREHFFANLRRMGTPPYRSADLVRAWMAAGQAGYGGGPTGELIRAVDNEGQLWTLKNGKAVVLTTV